MPGKHAMADHATMERPRPRNERRLSRKPLPLSFWRAVKQSLLAHTQDVWLDSFLPSLDRISFRVQRFLRTLPGRIEAMVTAARSTWWPAVSRAILSFLKGFVPTYWHRTHIAFKTFTGVSALITFVTVANPAAAVPLTSGSDWQVYRYAGLPTQTLRTPDGLPLAVSRDSYEVVQYFDYGNSKNAYFKMWLREDAPTVDRLIVMNADTPYDRFDAAMLALQALGIPYVFGGESPLGFDCSGLVRHVYAHFGIDLPHSVSAIDAVGKRVPASKAQAGDLVIWNDHSHMGIYLGDNELVHAPRPGSQVESRDLWDTNVHFVRISK